MEAYIIAIRLLADSQRRNIYMYKDSIGFSTPLYQGYRTPWFRPCRTQTGAHK